MITAQKTERQKISDHVFQRFFTGEDGSVFYTILYHAEIPRTLLAKAAKRTGAENTTLSDLIAMAADKYACGLSEAQVSDYLKQFADFM